MRRMTSDMSVCKTLLMTEGVMVRMPWNRNVPTATLRILALFTDAPPSRMEATAGRAM